MLSFPHYSRYVLKFQCAVIFTVLCFVPEISFGQKANNSCGLIVDAGPDIENCPGVHFNLKAKITGKYDSFLWEPPDGLSDPSALNPVANPGQRTVYTLTAMGVSDNLIKNGSFETGTISPSTSGFSRASSFLEMMNNGSIPEYYVANSADMASWYGSCRPKQGNYALVIHGNQNPNTPFWCQTIQVFPNTDYKIEYWITRSFRKFQVYIPEISMRINGREVASGVCGYICRWDQVTGMWNSGSATSATICLYNNVVGDNGNAAAIDEISVKECCVAKDSVEVKFVDIIADIQAPDITCPRPHVVVDASNSSNGPGWKFKWSTANGKIESGANTTKATVSRAGTYYLEICTPKGCCNYFQYEVYGSSEKPDLKLFCSDTLGCKKSEALITLKSNHNFHLYYDWKGPNGFVSQSQNITVGVPGKYYVTITDDYGCKSFDSIRVVEHADQPKVSLSGQALTCLRNETELTASSTVPNSVFRWRAPDGRTHTGASWKAISPGWYHVETTTPSGCVKRDSILVKEDRAIPDLTAAGEEINCLNPTAKLSASCKDPNARIQWIGPNGFTASSLNTVTQHGGKYILIASSANGCNDTAEVDIVVDTLRPDVKGGNAELTCIVDKLHLNPEIGGQYSHIAWKGPNGFASTDKNPLVTEPGKYTVELTARNGCKNSADIDVVANKQAPQLQTQDEHLNCHQPKVNLALHGDLTDLQINWKGPNGFSSDLPSPQVDRSGSYHVTAVNKAGCMFTASINITEDFTMPRFTTSDDILTCKVDSVILNLEANDPSYHISWKGPGGFVSNLKNPYTKSAGRYVVHVTGKNGCSDSAVVLITQDVNKPQIFVNDVSLDCKDVHKDITANSNRDTLSYQWQGPNGFTSTSKTIRVDKAGIYTVTVVTKDGCKSEQTVSVVADQSPPALHIPSGQLNCTVVSLNLSFTANRQVSNIQWTGPNGFVSTQLNPVVMQPGIYTLRAVADNFCPGVQTVEITQDTARPDVRVTHDEISCKNPEASISIHSATQGVQFNTTDERGIRYQGNTIRTKQGGNFIVEVTAPNTCKNQYRFTIPVDIVPPNVTTQDEILNCIKTSTPLVASYDAVNTSIKWSGPNNFSSTATSPVVSVGGTYQIEVVNTRNGCSTVKGLHVSMDTLKPSAVLSAQELDCHREVAEVSSIFQPSYAQLKWTDAGGNFITDQFKFEVRKGGAFNLQLTDPKNGCQKTETVTVYEDPLRPHDPELAIRQPKCQEKFGVINVLGVKGSHGDLSYSIDGGIRFTKEPRFSNLSPGLYTILIKDSKDCKVSVQANIFSTPYVETELHPLIELRLGESEILDLKINLPDEAIRSITWSPKVALSCADCKQPRANPMVSTDYKVTVVDTNGCESIAKVRVRVEDPKVWIPNVFSPNRDGVNDRAYIFSSNPDVTNVDIFQIYDRWGEMVFENRDFLPNRQEEGWDGNYRDQPKNPAVYVYYARINFINGNTVELKGDITLVR